MNIKNKVNSYQHLLVKLHQEQKAAHIIEVGHLLLFWIEDCDQKQIPISLATIQAKAMNLAATQKENYNYQETEAGPLAASKGCFRCFINWHELINLKSSGEAVAQIKMLL